MNTIHKDLPDKFLEYCHLIHGKGLVSGSGGNLSIRFGDRILITPGGRALQLLTPEDLVLLSMDGSYESGKDRKPSKEWRMHLNCYRRRDVRAVVHVHSVHAVAVSCLKDLDRGCAMPVYTPGYAIRVDRLPSVSYSLPGSEELALAVGEVISGRDSVMMENHGILAVGDCLEKALNIIEEIEENARIYFILNGRGKALTEGQTAGLAAR